MEYTKKNVAQKIDHTFLSPDGSRDDIIQLCREAEKYNFSSVAIAPDFVKLAAEELRDTNIDIDVAVGFPLGYTTTRTKIFETREALINGATEVDMVVNISAVKDKRWDHVRNDIESVAEITENSIFKIIFETCYLTQSEIKKLAEIGTEIVQVDYIKTSTGFGSEGATVENVRLMKDAAGADIKIKAAGGIRNLDDFKEMVEAGASRIGSSSGVDIVKECMQ